MKIALIRPNVVIHRVRYNGTPANVWPPLGLAYLAGSLKANGINVQMIDSVGEAIKKISTMEDQNLLRMGLDDCEIINRIDSDVDLIGISSSFSHDWFYQKELIQKIKKNTQKYIVLGGEHATADYEYILRDSDVDFCILGEGERKLINLLYYILNKNTIDLDLTGIVSKKMGFLLDSKKSIGNRIKDINQISWPDWDSILIENYFSIGAGNSSYGYRAMPMLASRGCPYRCTFCSSQNMWSTEWKAREVVDVIKEIKYYINKFNINRVEFYDLTAITKPSWIKEFCLSLIQEKLNISWSMPSGTRGEALTEEILVLLPMSGCDKINFAFDSLRQSKIDLLQKKYKVDKLLRAAEDAVKNKLIVKANIIIGFPFESFLDILKEVLGLYKLAIIGVDDVVIYNFTPYPGSHLHNQLVEQKKIIKDQSYIVFLKSCFTLSKNSKSWCNGLTAQQLYFLCYSGILYFYILSWIFRPKKVVNLIYRVLIVSKPITLIELALHSFINKKLILFKLNRNASGSKL